ncbi:MAG: MotA/TolQ/ExbB proton channel family protein [Prevotellaceae bacterium]|jgi:biopolymer transport protein ExbB|nr:MotA/TolQ/ExbB proton channel family protein [Prevotellaceae bacterium]
MNLFSILLQSTAFQDTSTVVSQVAQAVVPAVGNNAPVESYFSLLLKGGWILLPIFLLLLLAIYVIIERIVVLTSLSKSDSVWFARVNELLSENKIDKAAKFCGEQANAYARVVGAGLAEVNETAEAVQESMQSEANQQINRMERHLNWLGITASIAPMLGFLGTIFGVIKIFYDIALTNDFEIATISDGLYQKMICSGVGLFVGIIAYAGYYLLNGKVDRIVAGMDKYANETLRTIRSLKHKNAEL